MSSPSTPQPHAAPEALLQTRGVTVRFGGLVAVNGIDLDILPGTVHAVIGPNGAGKTTLFNVISRVIEPSEGAVRFAGEDLLQRRTSELIGMGVTRTFQNLQLFGLSSVYENISGALIHRFRGGLVAAVGRRGRRHNEEVRDRVLETAELLGIKNRLASYPASLPYGILKRVELARALVCQPRLVLLDEPAAGLNSEETGDLIEIFGRVAQSGVTMVLVEHDMNVVMRISDVVTVMDFGKKISEGSPSAVAADPEVIRVYLGETAAAGGGN